MQRLDEVATIDAHVHVWDRSRLRYDWLDDVPELAASRLPDAYDEQRGEVSRVVFVQAGAAPEDALAEAEWVQSLAPRWPLLAGIVADADLLSDPAVLAGHLDRLGELDLVRGVRHLLQDLHRDAFISDDFVTGLNALARRGVSFDACVRWWQLDDLAGTLRRASPMTVVLDHAGKPPMALELGADAWAGWEHGVRAFGALPGTRVKLSGLSPEAGLASMSAAAGDGGAGPTFLRRATRVVEVTLEVFGPERVMFGSDWPVSAVGGSGLSTAAWLDFVRSRVSDSEWREIAVGSAERAYRLGR